MPPKRNLVGQSFGRVTVIASGRVDRESYKQAIFYWLCQCECGYVGDFRQERLLYPGKPTTSCPGCGERIIEWPTRSQVIGVCDICGKQVKNHTKTRNKRCSRECIKTASNRIAAECAKRYANRHLKPGGSRHDAFLEYMRANRRKLKHANPNAWLEKRRKYNRTYNTKKALDQLFAITTKLNILHNIEQKKNGN